MLRLRDKLLPLARLSQPARRRARRRRKRIRRRPPGRQPDLRHRGGRRVPYRGNRGEAAVQPAAPHRHVLRQHHPRRRLGDHDHRSGRRRAGLRPHGRFADRGRRGSQAAAERGRGADHLAAGVPGGLRAAQGGAARADHPARGNRRPQDRAVERPPHGAIPRPADAAHHPEREGARQAGGLPAAPGVLGRQPLDGAGGGRDRGHRRGPPRHPGRQRQCRACSAPPSSRARRPRSSTSATSCRSPSRIGSAARSRRAASARARCC